MLLANKQTNADESVISLEEVTSGSGNNISSSSNNNNNNEKALRETQTLRTLAVVRFGHRPPARPLQTGPITIHCATAS